MIKMYGYMKCDTCRKAVKWLNDHGVEHTFIDITETPPPKTLIKSILKQGDHDLKDLFNKSGAQYRELNMRQRLPDMSEAEAIELLAANGRLCKRPIVTDGTRHTVGFTPEVFADTWRHASFDARGA